MTARLDPMARSVKVDGQRVPLTREGVLRKTGVGAALVESVKREIREQGEA
jgi:hypothetical protein